MTEDRFDYTEVLKSDMSGVVSSIIAHHTVAGEPLRAVLWSGHHHAWVSAPGTAAGLLYDDERFDRLRNVDRATAERVAREALRTELPPEEVLDSISEEGERMGWEYGPPRN